MSVLLAEGVDAVIRLTLHRQHAAMEMPRRNRLLQKISQEAADKSSKTQLEHSFRRIQNVKRWKADSGGAGPGQLR